MHFKFINNLDNSTHQLSEIVKIKIGTGDVRYVEITEINQSLTEDGPIIVFTGDPVSKKDYKKFKKDNHPVIISYSQDRKNRTSARIILSKTAIINVGSPMRNIFTKKYYEGTCDNNRTKNVLRKFDYIMIEEVTNIDGHTIEIVARGIHDQDFPE